MDINKIIYICLLIIFIPINFKVLMKLKLEKRFEQGAIWQIKYAYIVVTIIISHFMADFLISLQDIFKIQ